MILPFCFPGSGPFGSNFFLFREDPVSKGKHNNLKVISRIPSTEIFSTVILSLQEGQLSVSGERICTILINSLDD